MTWEIIDKTVAELVRIPTGPGRIEFIIENRNINTGIHKIILLKENKPISSGLDNNGRGLRAEAAATRLELYCPNPTETFLTFPSGLKAISYVNEMDPIEYIDIQTTTCHENQLAALFTFLSQQVLVPAEMIRAIKGKCIFREKLALEHSFEKELNEDITQESFERLLSSAKTIHQTLKAKFSTSADLYFVTPSRRAEGYNSSDALIQLAEKCSLLQNGREFATIAYQALLQNDVGNIYTEQVALQLAKRFIQEFEGLAKTEKETFNRITEIASKLFPLLEYGEGKEMENLYVKILADYAGLTNNEMQSSAFFITQENLETFPLFLEKFHALKRQNKTLKQEPGLQDKEYDELKTLILNLNEFLNTDGREESEAIDATLNRKLFSLFQQIISYARLPLEIRASDYDITGHDPEKPLPIWKLEFDISIHLSDACHKLKRENERLMALPNNADFLPQFRESSQSSGLSINTGLADRQTERKKELTP